MQSRTLSKHTHGVWNYTNVKPGQFQLERKEDRSLKNVVMPNNYEILARP